MQRTPQAILSFCLLPEESDGEPMKEPTENREPSPPRTELNATHAQLLDKLRLIAHCAETCRFLTIQSLEFQQIWQTKK